MTRNRLRLIWILPALALPVVGTSTPDAALKCGSMAPDGRPIHALDGVIRPHGVDRSEFQDNYTIDIVCMNPKDSTFNRTTGWGVVPAWTMQGPAPRVSEARDLIRSAQNAHCAKYGRYVDALEKIQLPESIKPVRITMHANDKGWVAHTTLPRLLQKCSMCDGAIPDTLAGRSA